MATQSAACAHPLHDNIIFKQSLSNKSKIVSIVGTHFVVVNETLLIIDNSKFVKLCPLCYRSFHIYIYGNWPDVRASFDGATDLPIRAVVKNIDFLPYIKICSALRFGKLFIYGSRLTQNEEPTSYFVMYGIKEDISGMSAFIHRLIFVNDRPAICCYTINGEIILIDSDGNIIKSKVAYSKTSTLFKIGNGFLTYKFDNGNMVWEHISRPALNTKPAAPSE